MDAGNPRSVFSRRSVLAGLAATVGAGWMSRSGLASTPAPAPASPSFSLKNARLLLGDGAETTGGLRVEAGVIAAVGPEVTEGEDLGGAVLWPGLYNTGCDLGLVEVDQDGATRDDADADAVSPQIRVLDGYDPRSVAIPVSRYGGVLGALILPGGRLVPGQAAWVRTAGDTVPEVSLMAPAAMVFRLGRGGLGGTGAPSSRLGAAAKLRDLLDAHEPPELTEPAEKPKKKKRDEPEEAKEPETETERVMWAVRRREMKVVIAADRASDLLVALELIAAYKLDALLLGATEGHLVASQIAAAQVPVLLGPITAQPSSFETLNARYDNAARLHAAGVRLAIRDPGHHNIRNLNLDAGIAARSGLPPGAALAAVTGNGPGFFGLKVGRLAPGFEANFVLSNGDPLQPRTANARIWMRGVELPMVSRQTELYERFRTLK